MNESTITLCSAWKVKWSPNRTEADQESKRKGVYTMLESEQFMWTYYYQMKHLGGADSESTSPEKEKAVKILIKTVWRRVDGIEITPESEEVANLVPMKLKKKTGKCTVMEPKAVRFLMDNSFYSVDEFLILRKKVYSSL
jgi:hypothetical protein